MDVSFIERIWNISKPYKVSEITIGHFNKIYRIDRDHLSFILRIYETESDINKIKREQSILNRLRKEDLSFELPVFIETVQREQIAFIPEHHKFAILMLLIPGNHPNLTNEEEQYQSGKALAELDVTLSKLNNEMIRDINPSYRELNHFHPRVNDIKQIVNFLPTTGTKKDKFKSIVLNILDDMEDVYNDLPKQFIHGDYTNGNRLISDGSICGIIDFEFFCFDVRAMDLAISLGGGPTALWEYGDGWNILETFAKGFLHYYPLTDREIRQIPFLIRLRRTAMLVYFYGRYKDGLDSEGYMRGIVDWLLEADEWLNVNSKEFVSRVMMCRTK